ncbi:MAG: outer membrane beta-barrel protein [bacterium]
MLDKRKLLLGAATLAAFVAVDSAAAESLFLRDRNTSVLQRERPEYDATGLRAGSFIVKPKVDLTIGYTDNVFALEQSVSPLYGDQSDTFFVLRPSVIAASDWNRHSLQFGAYAEGYQHSDFDAENVGNAGAHIDGRIDVLRNTAFLLGASYDLLHESRRVNNSVLVPIEPVEYERSKVYAGLQQEFGRIRYRGRLDYADYNYDDVQALDATNALVFSDQDFRDRADSSVLLEAGFATTRDSSVFLRGVYRKRDFDNLSNTVLAGGPLNRDSEGYTISTGVDFDITNLVRGSVALGYMNEDFDDARLSSIDGLSVEAGVEWFPTERTTLGVTAAREVRPSSIFSDDGIGGLVVNDAGYIANEIVLNMDHELRRNVILSASAGYGLDDYKDIDREDKRYAASLAATYLFNRNFAAKLQYNYKDQDTSATGATAGLIKDYTANELMLTLTAQY